MPQFTILAVAGTVKDIKTATDFPDEVHYDKIVKIYIPDDHGQFPDTSGYTSDNWENFSSTMEDHQLYPYMQKCVDAVLDYVVKKTDTLCRLHFSDVKSTIHGTNAGGDMFVIAGFVNAGLH